MKKSPYLLALACLALTVAGCAPSEESEPTEKPPVVFEGKIDPKLVGVWKTEAGNSTYELKEDGKYHLESKISTQGGSIDSKSDGEWLMGSDRLLFKDAQGNVVPYAVELADKKLTLSMTGTMKNKTVLLKQ